MIVKVEGPSVEKKNTIKSFFFSLEDRNHATSGSTDQPAFTDMGRVLTGLESVTVLNHL